MGEVVHLQQIQGDGTKIDPNAVLNGAMDRLADAVVIGIDNDGELYLACSEGRAETIALLERAKAKLVQSWLD